MNTAVINIKTDPQIKAQAQKTAGDLGFSLSSIINAFLKQFVKTKTISFSAVDEFEEIPNAKTQTILKLVEEDYKKGNTSPVFKTAEESIVWMKKQGIL